MKRAALIPLAVAFSPLIICGLVVAVVLGAWVILMTHREEQKYQLYRGDAAAPFGSDPRPTFNAQSR